MRDLKIDSLKGFLIICVLWGHIGVLTTNISEDKKIILWNNFHNIINYLLPVNYFHMPLFFALSIIFVKEINYLFLKKRFLIILVPYFFWYLYPIWQKAFFNPLPHIQNMLYGNWAHLQNILWFLPALFSINIYYALYRKIEKKYIFISIGFLAFLFAKSIASTYHVQIPFGIDLAFYLFPLLFIIDTIYQKKYFLNRINVKYSLLLIPLIFFWIKIITLFEPEKKFTPYVHRIDLAQFTVPFTIIGYISMICLSCTIFIFFLKIKESKILAMVGKYSLPIYLMHLIIMTKLINYYNKIPFNNNFLFLLLILFSIPLITFIAIIISKSLMRISVYFKYVGMVA